MTLLEDRIGRPALAASLHRRARSDWSAVLAELPPSDARWLEAWLRAEGWPRLRVVWGFGKLDVIDDAHTGLTGTVEIDVVTPDGVRREVVPFPSAGGAIPIDTREVRLDPRSRVPRAF